MTKKNRVTNTKGRPEISYSNSSDEKNISMETYFSTLLAFTFSCTTRFQEYFHIKYLILSAQLKKT